MDRNGPTALINSVLKIPADEICTSIAFNMKFAKPSFSENRRSIEALFRTFIAQGGQQLQVNVLDGNILAEALEDPDNHKNLIVRVGGYSDYFHNLPRNLQEEIVERSLY
jgi:formate C-acetyltransferase